MTFNSPLNYKRNKLKFSFIHLLISLLSISLISLDYYKETSASFAFARKLETDVEIDDNYYSTTTMNNNNNNNNNDDQQSAINTHYSPIVFVPGDGGSQLEAKLNKTERIHYICELQSDWYDLWLNIHLLVPLAFDCLIDNMRLHYNFTTRKTYNTPGVEIRPTNFGSLDSVDYLDIDRLPKTGYFAEVIAILEKNNGYIRNVDMVGAGFDFRKAPNELEIFFQNLTNLIELTYIKNNYKPVSLICHSMGCLNSFYLLNRKTQNWKDVFIKRLICLAAPFGGSVKAISAMLYGDNLGIPLLSSEKLKDLQSSFPSLMYLFPKEPTFSSDRILIQSSEYNYTLKNFDLLFNATNMIEQREMWHDTKDIAANLTAPNVELWCLYGSGIETPSLIVYDGDIKDGKYKEIEGDGDGTVNIESLRACESFQKYQDKPVYTRQFDKTDHIDILRNDDAANFISQYIMRGVVE